MVHLIGPETLYACKINLLATTVEHGQNDFTVNLHRPKSWNLKAIHIVPYTRAKLCFFEGGPWFAWAKSPHAYWLFKHTVQCWLLSGADSVICLSPAAAWVGRGILTLLPFQTVSKWPLSALWDKMAPPPLYMSGQFSSQHGCFAPIPNCLIFSTIPTYQNINLSAREAQQKLSQHPTWLTFSTNSSPHCLPSNGSGRQQRYGKWKYFLHISDRGLDSTLCW